MHAVYAVYAACSTLHKTMCKCMTFHCPFVRVLLLRWPSWFGATCTCHEPVQDQRTAWPWGHEHDGRRLRGLSRSSIWQPLRADVTLLCYLSNVLDGPIRYLRQFDRFEMAHLGVHQLAAAYPIALGRWTRWAKPFSESITVTSRCDLASLSVKRHIRTRYLILASKKLVASKWAQPLCINLLQPLHLHTIPALSRNIWAF